MQYDAMRCGSQGKPITSFGTFIMAIYPGAYVNISESIDDLPAIGKLKVALPFSTHIHTRFVRALRCVWHQEVPLADLSSRRSTALEPITTLRWHSLRCWASCGIRRCSRHSTTQVKVPWCSRCCRARRSMAICRRGTSSRRWARARCMIEHRWSNASRTCRVCPTRMASAAPPWRCCMQVSSIVPSTPRGFDMTHTRSCRMTERDGLECCSPQYDGPLHCFAPVVSSVGDTLIASVRSRCTAGLMRAGLSLSHTHTQ